MIGAGLAMLTVPAVRGMPPKEPPTDGSLWAAAEAANASTAIIGIRDWIFMVKWGLSHRIIVQRWSEGLRHCPGRGIGPGARLAEGIPAGECRIPSWQKLIREELQHEGPHAFAGIQNGGRSHDGSRDAVVCGVVNSLLTKTSPK